MNVEMTDLERESMQPLPDADELAARFEIHANSNPTSDETLKNVMENLSFGRVFTDHMTSVDWEENSGWGRGTVEPFAPIELSPAAAVLHYGQEIFEGIKAYRHEDGSVWTFRPGYNAARLRASARRLAMPEVSTQDFLGSMVALARVDNRWVPNAPGTSLYFRPFLISTEAFIGMGPSKQAKFMTIASPVASFFKGGKSGAAAGAGVGIWVTKDYHRAAPGGTGDAKCGGNYAAALLPQQQANQKGFAQVCYLDVTNQYLEELGGMNVFVVMKDGSVATPALTGTILAGATRASIVTLLRDQGIKVTERRISLAELIDGISSGDVVEIFACGTAAVVSPIGRLAGEGFDLQIPGGDVVVEVKRLVTGIQTGQIEDTRGWMYRLV